MAYRLITCLAVLTGATGLAQPITITLAGQSMIRSDIRVTAPAAVPVISALLKGDVVFTNFEAASCSARITNCDLEAG